MQAPLKAMGDHNMLSNISAPVGMAVRYLVAVLFLLAGMALLAPTAGAEEGDRATVHVERGTHEVLRRDRAVVRVAVGDSAIAEVNVINRRELLITGHQIGETSLLIWTQGVRDPERARLKVVPTSSAEREPDPDLASARIDAGRSLGGRVPNLAAHRRARERAQAGTDAEVRDGSVVELETQVLTEIKIAEVSRSSAQRYGLNLSVNPGNHAATISGPGGISSAGTGAPSTLPVPISDAFNLVLGRSSNNLLGVLSVLESKGMARTLAEPSLTAMSGQTATFLAGGEFPVPVSQGGATAGGITVEFKEFGVRLNLTPTVLSRDRIGLKVAPEVSELDFSAGIQIGGVSVPALRVRRTDTTVELGSGESFVISGLVSSSQVNNVDKVPWLGDVPILGAFFRAAARTQEERELIMVVTPHLVRPMARGAQLPELPGSEEARYNPRMDQTMFMERGRFDNSAFGFSR